MSHSTRPIGEGKRIELARQPTARQHGAMFRVLACLVALWLSFPADAQGLRDDCAAGQRRCGTICCPASHRCSWDGHCIPPGGNYCGGGVSCPPGQICTGAGTSCAPHGSTRCRDGTICRPGTVCAINGGCTKPGGLQGLDLTRPDPQTGCLPGGGCSEPGWFQCEETDSECRPGFKCSKGRGCVPVKAVDCGFGKWCRPGEQCVQGGGCTPTERDGLN